MRGALDAGGLIGTLALEGADTAGAAPALTGALEFGTGTMSIAMDLLDVQPMFEREQLEVEAGGCVAQGSGAAAWRLR